MQFLCRYFLYNNNNIRSWLQQKKSNKCLKTLESVFFFFFYLWALFCATVTPTGQKRYHRQNFITSLFRSVKHFYVNTRALSVGACGFARWQPGGTNLRFVFSKMFACFPNSSVAVERWRLSSKASIEQQRELQHLKRDCAKLFTLSTQGCFSCNAEWIRDWRKHDCEDSSGEANMAVPGESGVFWLISPRICSLWFCW